MYVDIRRYSDETMASSGADTSQVALKQRGIDKLLEEAREDNKENDATHMGKRK